jgi:hypothetical protein
MSLLRLLNIQGIAGIAFAVALSVFLLIQRGETAHWKNQSGHFEQLYAEQQATLATTVADYRAAAEQARASDEANAQRVAAEQRSINERTSNDYEARLAAARQTAERLSAQRLRSEAAGAAANRRNGGGAPVPGLSATAGGSPQGAGEDRLPQSDRLTATEEAIQLDELIKWVRRQAEVKPNGGQR